MIGVHSVATCEAVFEATRDWVRQRKAFGRRVADLQTVQHKLAEVKTSIAVARAFIDQCMELHEVGKCGNELASMAKYWTTELENKTIYGGTNEIMKELIARSIVKDAK